MPVAIAAAALSALTLSGPTAIGATTGIRPASSASVTAGSVGRARLADQAELGHRVGLEPDLVAEERHRALADRGAERVVHGGERPADDLEPGGGRHAAAADELDGDARRAPSRG